MRTILVERAREDTLILDDFALTPPSEQGRRDLQSATVPGGTCPGTTTITCTFPALAAGASETATVVVRTSTVGARTVTFRSDSYIGDPVTTNHEADLAFTVAAPSTGTGGTGGTGTGTGGTGTGGSGTGGTGGTPGGDPQPRPLPRVTIVAPRGALRLPARSRVLRLTLSCPATASSGCAIGASVRSVQRRGRRFVTPLCSVPGLIRPGRRAVLACTFTPVDAAWTATRAGRAFRFTVRSTDGTGRTATTTLVRAVRRS